MAKNNFVWFAGVMEQLICRKLSTSVVVVLSLPLTSCLIAFFTYKI